MRYFLTGVETINKGAELMLYSILQEIERCDSHAEVYIEKYQIPQGVEYIDTSINMELVTHPLEFIKRRTKLGSILTRLKLPSIRFVPKLKDIDYLIDGSGLCFADKMTTEETYIFWKKILEQTVKNNVKVVFLPQAFGPFNNVTTKKTVRLLSKNADLICARDYISYNYLRELNGFDMSKVSIFTDFTSLVTGKRPEMLRDLDGKVCIIPNMQMVSKGVMSYKNYISYLAKLIERIRKKGCDVYVLNHQGEEDERILRDLKLRFGGDLKTVSGLNAIETKGLISTSYIVLTSRFHGLASALNSCIPCLATSWNHKYKCLFEDYKINSSILSLTNFESDWSLVDRYLNPQINRKIRNLLVSQSERIKGETVNMWRFVWSLKEG